MKCVTDITSNINHNKTAKPATSSAVEIKCDCMNCSQIDDIGSENYPGLHSYAIKKTQSHLDIVNVTIQCHQALN